MIVQYTVEEIASLTKALTDLPSMRNWNKTSCELIWDNGKFCFVIPRLLSMNCVSELGIKNCFLLQLFLNKLMLNYDTEVDLRKIATIFFTAKSAGERARQIQLLWDATQLLCSLTVTGSRSWKSYSKQKSKTLQVTYENTRLFEIDKDFKTLHEKFVLSVPTETKHLRNAGNFAQYVPGLDKIISIPGDNPAGEWAQCIALNMNQLRRVRENKDNQRDKQEYRRIVLLSSIAKPVKFPIERYQSTRQCGRLKKYWNAALQILLDRELLFDYQENENSHSYHWVNTWLNETVRLFPNKLDYPLRNTYNNNEIISIEGMNINTS